MATMRFECSDYSVPDCPNGGNHVALLEQATESIYGGDDPYYSDVCEGCGQRVEAKLNRGLRVSLVKLDGIL